jgi:hypothetical protein
VRAWSAFPETVSVMPGISVLLEVVRNSTMAAILIAEKREDMILSIG